MNRARAQQLIRACDQRLESRRRNGAPEQDPYLVELRLARNRLETKLLKLEEYRHGLAEVHSELVESSTALVTLLDRQQARHAHSPDS